MKSSVLLLGLVGCIFPAPPPSDTGDGTDSGTADTGPVDTDIETDTGTEDTGAMDTGTGDTGTASTGTHGGRGDISGVWHLVDFGIDSTGALATIQTADGPIDPRLRVFFSNSSWNGVDFDDIENYCVITFDTVQTVNPARVTSDPAAWFGIDFDPSRHGSNCSDAWGDVYGTYLSGWTGGWGVSVGGELVHLTIDTPGYGSSFGPDEPWVFDARAVHSLDGFMAAWVTNPDIDFWTYGYEVDASMNAVTDGSGDRIPMLDADVYLGNHTLASGWYEVTGLWFYGIEVP